MGGDLGLVVIKVIECAQICDRFGKAVNEESRAASVFLRQLQCDLRLVGIWACQAGSKRVRKRVSIVANLFLVEPLRITHLSICKFSEYLSDLGQDRLLKSLVLGLELNAVLFAHFHRSYPDFAREVINGLLALGASRDSL
jgi:hypothetical protein